MTGNEKKKAKAGIFVKLVLRGNAIKVWRGEVEGL